MRLKILLFAALRERMGVEAVEIELEPGSRVADLRRGLSEQFPTLGPLLSRCAIAVAEEFADDETVLRPEEVVALIPPVSGGQ